MLLTPILVAAGGFTSVQGAVAAHIARLTIDNPERKNCYDPQMRRAMGAAMDDVANDDDMKVLLLRGTGGVFSAGADIPIQDHAGVVVTLVGAGATTG